MSKDEPGLSPELYAWYERELEAKRRAYERGFINALFEALSLCYRRECHGRRDPHGEFSAEWDPIDIPRWLAEAMGTEIRDLADEVVRQKPNHRPSASKWERYRKQDLKYRCWDLVKEAMDHGYATSASPERESAFEAAATRSREWLGVEVTANQMRDWYYDIENLS